MASPAGGLRQQTQALLRSHCRRTTLCLRKLGRNPRPSSIHAARVSVRKWRTILDGVAPALEPAACSRLHRRLKRAAAELGTVRDTDVRCRLLLPLLRSAEVPASANSLVSLRTLASRLHSERSNARRHLLLNPDRALSTDRLRAMSQLVVNSAPLQSGAGPDALLAKALRKRLRQLVRQLRAEPATSTTRHALRKRIRRYRHLLEAVGSPPRRRRSVRALDLLHELQDCLGEMNDLAMACRWVKRQRFQPEAAQAIRKRLQARKKKLLARVARLRACLRPRVLALPGGKAA